MENKCLFYTRQPFLLYNHAAINDVWPLDGSKDKQTKAD